MEAERERYRDTTASLLESGRQANPSVRFEREGAEELAFADEVPVIAGTNVYCEDCIWIERRAPTGYDDGPTDIVTPDGDYIGPLPPQGGLHSIAYSVGGL
ncbi:hypothetical protein [Candidatus Palauibacter sp.]|uniref:hypothetical protein n=1 Tax=Candidatus Palauibacter sp. TaxID=3101350 RepID=UPI003B52E3ED